MPRLKSRDHSFIWLAAGLMRCAAVLEIALLIAIAVGFVGTVRVSALGAAIAPDSYGTGFAIVVVLIGLINALMLWAFADVLTIVADADDTLLRSEVELLNQGKRLDELLGAIGNVGSRRSGGEPAHNS